MTGGERLRQLREANGLPHRILAEWMNVSQTIIQRIEEGRREPYPHEIDAAVKVFRISLQDFYSGASLTHGMTSGERLCALRKANAWTLYDLAIRCGVHTVTVSAWECGGQTPSKEQLEKLADVFGVKPETVCGGPKWRTA